MFHYLHDNIKAHDNEEASMMNVMDLRRRFITVSKQEPVDEKELLHFAKLCYVSGDIKIVEYKKLVKALEKVELDSKDELE
ncbi:hypothetical protein FZW96_02455 [Bacillus sp. BGMRC 2118]|nr:hypothetical protein FZW96_02455 [Bacillus sp. BGMRC 2118]